MKEKEIVPAVSQLLERRFPLVMPSSRDRLRGRGEFAIEIPGETSATRRVDVVAARWEGNDQLHTVAVECKITANAVLDALGQGVHYQSFFDEVFIATPEDLDNNRLVHSALVDLGLGHIRVAKNAEITVQPVSRWPARFSPNRHPAIARKFALGLAFLDGIPPERRTRYGYFERNLGIWFGEEVCRQVQWQCFFKPGAGGEEIGAGINIERAEDVRRVLKKGDVQQLQRAIDSLPDSYSVETEHRPNPSWARQSPTVDRQLIRDCSIEDTFERLAGGPKKTTPRLWIGRLWGPDERQDPSRERWVETLNETRSKLSDLLGLFSDAVR